MNVRRTSLLVALVLAIGTGWLTLNYINGIQRASTTGANAPRVVLVAGSDIPARATITADMLRRTVRPASAVEPDALADPEKAIGQLALITIPAGSTITQSRIGSPTEVGLPVRLAPGMRAVSIAIDKVKGVSGLVQPGDRVDVIAIPPKQGTQQPAAATILRGLRVLALGTSLEERSATPSPDESNSTTVTLEVTPKQADLLESADVNTTLRLALRSPREPLNSMATESLTYATEDPPAAPAPGPAAGFAGAVPAAQGVAMAQPAIQAQQTQPQRARPSGGDIMIVEGDHVGYISPSSLLPLEP